MSTEFVHLKPVLGEAACDVHEWPDKGLARRLIDRMRLTHGKGGVNVCVPCIDRARDDAAIALTRAKDAQARVRDMEKKR